MGVQAPVSARPNAAWRPLYSVLGDERLARLVSDGNKQAFAPLYERYYQQLYRYCRSIVHDDLDAQDALQSTFASAFAALRKSQRDAPLRPWLFRIAHNEAVSVIRRRRPTEDLSEASEHCGDSVEQQAGERARFSLLLRDLRELPERQRSALVMRELSGLSHEEIAMVLGTSVGAAKQTIFEARRSLSEFAEGRVMQCDEVRKVVSDADGRTLRSRRVRAHLEDCSGCADFAAAIATRTADLRAFSPALPATAAAAVLARALGAGSSHGSGGAAGLAAGTAGKTAGAALATKAVAGVVIVAAGTAGAVAGLGQVTGSSHPPAARASSPPGAHTVKNAAASAPAAAASSATGRRGTRQGAHANPSTRPSNRPATAAAKTKLTRLAGISTPASAGHGAKAAAGAPAVTGTAGSTTPQQQAQAPSKGSQGAAPSTGDHSGSPARGTGSSPVTVSAPGGSATVSVPGGSASVSLPGASATVSVPNGSASVSVPGASASASVPNGSASVSVPGASATVSVPNGTTVSVGGQPTLHLPGLGSVLGPLGGSGSHTH
jgi:RNA polymerase sigma factor (sigma-70 family)